MLQSILAIFALLLFAATAPLWRHPTTFPQIPWFSLARLVPPIVDVALIVVIGVGLVVVVIANVFESTRLARSAFCIAWLAMAFNVALDQQRLQPWVWQFLLLIPLWAACPPPDARRGMGWLTISIYIWSAVSKFDTAFLTGHGQIFVDGAANLLGLEPARWPEEWRPRLAFFFPAGELLVGLGLLLPAMRRYALIASLLMHGSLIALLGPWGLDHSPGVLLWNAFFIASNIFVFRPAADADVPAALGQTLQRGCTVAKGLVAAAIILPATASWGLWDHWPSWVVYAARPERVEIDLIFPPDQPPPQWLDGHLAQPQVFTSARRVLLDAWSFQERSCPVYPQGRFRLACAAAVIARLPDDVEMRVSFESQPARMTGERTAIDFETRDELAAAMSQYWVNTHPR